MQKCKMNEFCTNSAKLFFKMITDEKKNKFSFCISLVFS